jgi:hypothetical protein
MIDAIRTYFSNAVAEAMDGESCPARGEHESLTVSCKGLKFTFTTAKNGYRLKSVESIVGTTYWPVKVMMKNTLDMTDHKKVIKTIISMAKRLAAKEKEERKYDNGEG